jgi:hypothetical protein
MELRDSNGLRLVIGQDVFCKSISRVGQVLGALPESGECWVMLRGDGRVVTVPANQVYVATWKQIKTARYDRNSAPTTIYPEIVAEVLA